MFMKTQISQNIPKMLTHLIDCFREGEKGKETPTPQRFSRREALIEVPRDLATIVALSLGLSFSRKAEAEMPELGNYLVLDMDGKPRNYAKPGAPVCAEPIKTAVKCSSGIVSYLKLSGKPALLVFMAYYCEPCIEDLPHLNDIYNKYQGRLQVVGLNHVDEKDESLAEQIRKTKEVLREHDVKFPNLMMLKDYMDAALNPVYSKGSALPQTLLVRDVRKIVYHTRAIYEESQREALMREIEKLV